MIGICAHEDSDNFVAYTDVGEGRKQGAEALKILQIACYKVNCACAREGALGFAAMFALFSLLSCANLFKQN